MKLLLVEKEIGLLNSISAFFRNEGFIVETVTDFDAAKVKVNLYNYDCVIGDNLEDDRNFEQLKALRAKKPETGVIVTSSRDDIIDKIKAFEAGADDYIVKPYNLQELEARLFSLIRRRVYRGLSSLQFGPMSIDTMRRSVTVCGKTVNMTRKEYDLLLYMASNHNKVLTHEMIAEQILGDYIGTAADNFDFIYTHVKNIRKKLKYKGLRNFIKTIYGVGYTFSLQPATQT